MTFMILRSDSLIFFAVTHSTVMPERKWGNSKTSDSTQKSQSEREGEREGGRRTTVSDYKFASALGQNRTWITHTHTNSNSVQTFLSVTQRDWHRIPGEAVAASTFPRHLNKGVKILTYRWILLFPPPPPPPPRVNTGIDLPVAFNYTMPKGVTK